MNEMEREIHKEVASVWHYYSSLDELTEEQKKQVKTLLEFIVDQVSPYSYVVDCKEVSEHLYKQLGDMISKIDNQSITVKNCKVVGMRQVLCEFMGDNYESFMLDFGLVRHMYINFLKDWNSFLELGPCILKILENLALIHTWNIDANNFSQLQYIIEQMEILKHE